jgi:hypothetical protein
MSEVFLYDFCIFISALYAQTMAERGFLTIAFDPSFTGESGGQPRSVASPDINTEDFMAAVDFLSVQPNVDPDRVGIIGICGWGGMALNAAALDTRIKATVTSTMYNMSRVNANGYFDAQDSEEARYNKKVALNAQRTKEYRQGYYGAGRWCRRPAARGRSTVRNKTTTTTTRRRVAIMSAAATPMTAGPRRLASRSSISPSCNIPRRSTPLY